MMRVKLKFYQEEIFLSLSLSALLCKKKFLITTKANRS